jgi:hypothetical protein
VLGLLQVVEELALALAAKEGHSGQ